NTILVGFGGLLSIIGIAESGYFFPALLSFGVMTMFYELLWLANRESFFVATPAVSVARYQFLLDSVGATLMSICALGYAVFMELFGFQMGILSFLVVSFVFMMIIGIASNIRPKEIVF
ncbi:MAG TPA: hypothetical protein VGO47_01155, partial [Chlamydiales bacterium]|nr:hypothetical protein [Chlamydiales bacterium]